MIFFVFRFSTNILEREHDHQLVTMQVDRSFASYTRARSRISSTRSHGLLLGPCVRLMNTAHLYHYYHHDLVFFYLWGSLHRQAPPDCDMVFTAEHDCLPASLP